MRRLRRWIWEYRAWRRWCRSRTIGRALPSPQLVPWDDRDGKALALFLATASGARMRLKIATQEAQMNADAVRAVTDLTYACGYAGGARGMAAWILSLADTPDSPPEHEHTADPAEWGEDELRERYSP